MENFSRELKDLSAAEVCAPFNPVPPVSPRAADAPSEQTLPDCVAFGPLAGLYSADQMHAMYRAGAGMNGTKVNPDWKPGEWLEVQTLDEMQVFYMARLPAIREAAKKHGYAIGLHGTARRDFDLMAMAWRDDASDKDALAHAIAMAACGITRDCAYQWEKKPSGRFAVSLPICVTNCSNPDFDKPSIGHIDLSVIESRAADALDSQPLPGSQASIGEDALWARVDDIRLRFANPTSIPRSTLLHYAECLLAQLAILRASAPPVAAVSSAAPILMAYVATDLDGHADVGLTIESAKERAGLGCDTIIALHDISTQFVEDNGIPTGFRDGTPVAAPLAPDEVTSIGLTRALEIAQETIDELEDEAQSTGAWRVREAIAKAIQQEGSEAGNG